MSLTIEARAAHTADLAAVDAAAIASRAAVDAAALAARREARQAGTNALRDVLIRPNGTAITLGEARLTVKHDDMAAGLVVWGDTDGVLLAACLRDDVWTVRLVRLVDDEYEVASDVLTDLADLGAALAGQ